MRCARHGCDADAEVRLAWITSAERWRVRNALLEDDTKAVSFQRDVASFCLSHGRETWTLLRKAGTNPVFKRLRD